MSPDALIPPVVALVSLTALLWLAMVATRLRAVFRGAASARYYRGYDRDHPPEWVERPARAFMNLLEVPLLFYVVCVLMLVTRTADGTQVALAWVFVAVRAVHAGIHVGVNYVPARLAAYLAGCLTLAAIWVRFALQHF
jgi:hypothetical protein